MEHKAYFKNKTRNNIFTTHSDTKRNIPKWFSLPLIVCIAHIPLTKEQNRADFGYQVHGTERKISHLLSLEDMKLLGRNEFDVKNGITIVKTISKYINMNFLLEKCGRIC